MSKTKETVEELRKKLFERKKEDAVENAEKVIEAQLDGVVYDVVQDPSTKSRAFLMVKIVYDINTKQAVVEDVIKFNDKTAAFGMNLDKENRKYLFEKNKGNKK
mgnify:FL=1